MRPFGICLVVVGALWIIYALNMDVSVSVPTTYVPYIGSVGGGEVANIDMMARRQNHLMIGGLITLIGALMAIFGKPMEEPSSQNALSRNASKQTRFDGERDLSSDPYRLWLAKRYGVQRNEVFNRFVVGDDQTFDTLDDALDFAHNQEVDAALAAERAEEERQARMDAAAKQQRLIQEEADAAWERSKPKVLVGSTLAIIMIVSSIWFSLPTAEERAARLAMDAAEEKARVAEAIEKLGVDLPPDAQEVRVETAVDSVWCDNATPDTVAVHFKSDEDAKSTKEHFVEQLGEGARKYEFLDDDFDWNWTKSGASYQLVFYEEGPTTAVICRK